MRVRRLLSREAWAEHLYRQLRKLYPRAAPFFGARYVHGGVISWHPMPNVGDYRRYVVRSCARACRHLDGDFISMGVARGDAALDLMRAVDPPNVHWLIDAWDGRMTADRPAGKSWYTSDLDQVRQRFAAWPRVKFLKGLVPAVLADLPPAPIAFGHFNLADPQSEAAALPLLLPRLMRGGIIVIDGFARPGTGADNTRRYMAEAEGCGVTLLAMPTGHALLFGEAGR